MSELNGVLVSESEGVLDFDGSLARSEGLRVNAEKAFRLLFTGRECYSLMTLLREYAKSEDSFDRIECLVLWHRKIRAQLKDQGF